MRPKLFVVASFVLCHSACASKPLPTVEIPNSKSQIPKEPEERLTAVLFRFGDINQWSEFDCLLWNPLESPRRSFLAAKLADRTLQLSGLVLGDELYDQVVQTFVLRGIHIQDRILGVPGWLALCRKEGIVIPSL